MVERGSLHLYIVATREIEEGEEVTLALETANSTLELVCCLAEEHDCQAPPGPRPEQTTPAPALTHKKNGLIVGSVFCLLLWIYCVVVQDLCFRFYFYGICVLHRTRPYSF